MIRLEHFYLLIALIQLDLLGKKLFQPNKETLKNKGYSNIVSWTKHRNFLSHLSRSLHKKYKLEKKTIKIVLGKILNYEQFLFLTNQNVWK